MDVVSVRTRILSVLVDGSAIANTWSTINKGLHDFQYVLSVEEKLALLFGLFIIASEVRGRDEYRRLDYDELAGPWRSIVIDINEILTKIGFEKTIPSELRQVLGKESHRFDASSFWRNWNQLM